MKSDLVDIFYHYNPLFSLLEESSSIVGGYRSSFNSVVIKFSISAPDVALNFWEKKNASWTSRIDLEDVVLLSNYAYY